jgi:hypothetical protein
MLTQQQWQALKNVQAKILNLESPVHQLVSVVQDVCENGDPADPFNSEMTIARLQEIYMNDYTSLKAQILAAYNLLP